MRNESSTVHNRVYPMSDMSAHMRNSDVSSSRRMVVRRQKIALAAIALIAVILVICTFLFGAIHTQAAPSEITCKYYTSIEVKSGDTLWSIASEHITDDYENMNDYIEEVCSINKISQNEIHAGQYITIPYYSSVTVAEN